jgi:hypothetical protein
MRCSIDRVLLVVEKAGKRQRSKNASRWNVLKEEFVEVFDSSYREDACRKKKTELLQILIFFVQHPLSQHQASSLRFLFDHASRTSVLRCHHLLFSFLRSLAHLVTYGEKRTRRDDATGICYVVYIVG